MTIEFCTNCNTRIEYTCRFNKNHTHDSSLIKYCKECDLCQEDTSDYDHCINCNTKCAKDYNATICNTCKLNNKNSLIDCKICVMTHSVEFNCDICNTCSWQKQFSDIYHCEKHNICHNYDSNLPKFKKCIYCNKCYQFGYNGYCNNCYFTCIICEKICSRSTEEINGHCKKCYVNINNKYCIKCNKIHSGELNNYDHCYKCKKCYKWWNVFAQIHHYDCVDKRPYCSECSNRRHLY